MKNKMMQIQMLCNMIPSIPDMFHFIKEGHVLEYSRSLVDLYKKCLRMGYDIREAEVDILYYTYESDSKLRGMTITYSDKPFIKERIDQTLYDRTFFKRLRDYEYKHRKENNAKNL